MRQRLLARFTFLCLCTCAFLCFHKTTYANGIVCILKPGDYNLTNPCSTAKTEAGGNKTLIHFDSCSQGPHSVVVAFEGSGKAVSFKTSVTYNQTKLLEPLTCTPDPQDYFSDVLVSVACPAISGVDHYVYAAEANLFNDNWPDGGDSKFILVQIDFSGLNLSQGEKTNIMFYHSIPAREPGTDVVFDWESDLNESIETLIDAEVTCTESTRGVNGTIARIQRAASPVIGTGFPLTGVSGLTIELLRDGVVVDSAVTQSDGTFSIPLIESPVGNKYTMRMIVSESSGLPYDPGTMVSGTGYRTLAKNVTIIEDYYNMPMPFLGDGPSMGDTDCNGYVDVRDLTELKNCFGSDYGGPKYNFDCDFDGNGSVDVLDFVILKNNFGLIGQAPPPGTCVD